MKKNKVLKIVLIVLGTLVALLAAAVLGVLLYLRSMAASLPETLPDAPADSTQFTLTDDDLDKLLSGEITLEELTGEAAASSGGEQEAAASAPQEEAGSAASSGTTGSAGASGITASSSVFFLGILLSSLAHILVDMMESLSVFTNSLRLLGTFFDLIGCSVCFGAGENTGLLRHSGIWAEALQSRSFFAS